VVSTTEQSCNMKKALKEKIYETVSTLRHLFVKIKISGDRKQSEINKLTDKASKLETELHRCRARQEEAHQTPSLANTTERSGQRARLHGTTSFGVSSVTEKKGAQSVALPTGNMSRQYVRVIKETKHTKYKMTGRSRGAHLPEEIKQILRTILILNHCLF